MIDKTLGFAAISFSVIINDRLVIDRLREYIILLGSLSFLFDPLLTLGVLGS